MSIRATLLLVVAMSGTAPAADPIQWRTDYNTARKEAQDKGLPMIVSISTEECLYCRKMDATTFADANVAALLNGRFIPLKVDGNKEANLVQALRVQMYPTTVIAGADGKIHAFLSGYVTVDQLKDNANRAVLAVTTPDWVARDLQEANKAIAASDNTRAVSLLKGIVTEAKDSPARVKASQVLAEVEQSAADRLARAKTLEDRGETSAAMDTLAGILKGYAGTNAANDAAGRLAGLASKSEHRDRFRTDRARDLLAQAREEFKTGRFADCLEHCDHLAAFYPDLSEGKDSVSLGMQIKTDPERMAAACDQLNDRTASMYLALADTWTRKGQSKEAASCLEKVVKLCPNTRHAEVAQANLTKLQKGTTPAVQAGFETGK